MRFPALQPLERRMLFDAVLADGILTVTGTAGNDAIAVRFAADVDTFELFVLVFVNGGSSNDRLEGGLGADTMYGHGQDDRFFSFRDGAVNLLFGGPGFDTARADPSDVFGSIISHVIS